MLCAAVRAYPDPDRQRHFSSPFTTSRTRLGRGRPLIKRYEMLPGPLSLVRDLDPQAMPARVADRLREAVVLLHILDLQSLDDDRLVVVNQTSGQFVMEVGARIGDALMRRRYEPPCLGSVLRSFPFAGKRFLLAAQVALRALNEAWVGCLTAGAFDSNVSEPYIDPDNRLLRNGGRKLWNGRIIFEEASGKIFPGRRPGQRDGFEFANRFAVHDCGNMSGKLGDRDPVRPDCHLAGAVIARLRSALALEPRKACAAPEEIDKGAIEIAARLLQSHRIIVIEPSISLGPLGNGDKWLQIVFCVELIAVDLVPVTLDIERFVPHEADSPELPIEKVDLSGLGVDADLDGAPHRSNAFLIFDIAFDRGEWGAPNSGHEIAVGPKRRQPRAQLRKFLPQQTRRAAFDQLDEAVNTELRISLDEQMHVSGHNLAFNHDCCPLFADLRDDFFEPYINTINQNLSPILWAEDDVELAIERNIPVGAHPMIYSEDIYNVKNSVFGLWPNAYPSPALNGGGSRRFC